MSTSALERRLLAAIDAAGLPAPATEYTFYPGRRWRFDFAWPEVQVAVEMEGGTWAGGRHTTGAGFAGDCEKYNAAVLAGWRVLRFTGPMIRDGSAVATVRQVLSGRTVGAVALRLV